MKTQPSSEAETEAPSPAKPADPRKNPSYPQRVHAHERAHWESVLKSCDERIATARKKLSVVGDSPRRPELERLFSQLLGARDQVADAAGRLPGETGDLYDEDKHRLEEGVAAIERVLKRWD